MNMDRIKVLITGILGQDGSYLSEIMVREGAQVFGMALQTPQARVAKWRARFENGDSVHIRQTDISDRAAVEAQIAEIVPDYIFNLAGLSSVLACTQSPVTAVSSNVEGARNIFESARRFAPQARIFQAASSEMYGTGSRGLVNEEAVFKPDSIYGMCKYLAFQMAREYREKHGMFISTGILFNHESHRRSEHFVTRKIVRTLMQAAWDKTTVLEIGRLDIERDWAHASDFAHAMISMLRADKPGNYVVGTGRVHSIRTIVELAARHMGMELTWTGSGLDEVGVDVRTGRCIVSVDKRYYRSEPVDPLAGDSSLLQVETGWKPAYSFEALIEDLVTQTERELKAAKST